MTEDSKFVLTGEQLLNVDVAQLPAPSDPGKLLVVGAKKKGQVVQLHGLGLDPVIIGPGCMIALKYGPLGWNVQAAMKEPDFTPLWKRVLKQLGVVLGAGVVFWAASWAYFFLFVKC